MNDLSKVKAGDHLYCYGPEFMKPFVAKVDRISPTQVITVNGVRFRRKDGALCRSHESHLARHLVARVATADEVRADLTAQKQEVIRNLVRTTKVVSKLTEAETDIISTIFAEAIKRLAESGGK